MTEPIREGGCGCGAVRYRVSGEPIFVNNCHCTQCQHQTGSTSVVNAFFESERIELLAGTLAENTVKAGSGGPHVIVRCAACGAAVWSFYPRFGRLWAPASASERLTTAAPPELRRQNLLASSY